MNPKKDRKAINSLLHEVDVHIDRIFASANEEGRKILAPAIEKMKEAAAISSDKYAKHVKEVLEEERKSAEEARRLSEEEARNTAAEKELLKQLETIVKTEGKDIEQQKDLLKKLNSYITKNKKDEHFERAIPKVVENIKRAFAIDEELHYLSKKAEGLLDHLSHLDLSTMEELKRSETIIENGSRLVDDLREDLVKDLRKKLNSAREMGMKLMDLQTENMGLHSDLLVAVEDPENLLADEELHRNIILHIQSGNFDNAQDYILKAIDHKDAMLDARKNGTKMIEKAKKLLAKQEKLLADVKKAIEDVLRESVKIERSFAST